MSTRTPLPDLRKAAPGRRFGFSLMELLIVIAVTVILTSMVLPAMNKLRENVHRVVCGSNMRQIGIGMGMFATANHDQLPGSAKLTDANWEPSELMAAWQNAEIGWDGLGILFEKGYCGAFQCFYCPSHTGSHPIHRYATVWDDPGDDPIYMNMHYTGNRDWRTRESRTYSNLSTLVLVTDGLRTASDFNHSGGMNLLYGDMSVHWRSDLVVVAGMLPTNESGVAVGVVQRYADIWGQLQQLINPTEY